MRALLRLEGLTFLIAACLAYAGTGAGWGWFAMLFLVPDIALLGYLAGPSLGAALYNAAHSYAAALIFGMIAHAADWRHGLAGSLIWIAHIGFDRALGFGLKYASGFKNTHLGRIGG